MLREHAPDTAATLALPASDGEISELEKVIGRALPGDLRESMKIHNGQNDPGRCHAFTGEGMLLTTHEIADRWKMVTEVDETHRFSAAPGVGPWWKRSCIPFTDAEGNMLCVDMDAALQDRVGEIVCHVHDSEIERGISTSFRAWLSLLAERLEAGRFRIDDYGYLWLETELLPPH